MKKFYVGGAAIPAAILAALAFSPTAKAQQTGLLVPGSGATFLNYLPLVAGAIPVGQGVTANPAAALLSGDCTMNSTGVMVCLKTNNTAFGTAAIANVGTSGATLPQLNASNTWAAGTLQSYAGHIASAGSPPVVTACGGGLPAIVGDDSAGEVTNGTSSTGCVITFAAAYTAAPMCTVTWQATPLASQSYSVSITAITTVQTSASSNKINYNCRARSGG